MLLARSLNYRSISDLCENMDSAEFCLWAAEFGRSPWDEARADLRAGIIASTIANYSGKSLKTGASVTPLDCMPYSQPEPEKASDSAADIVAILQNFS